MLTYGNHFVGNNYFLSGAPEIIDITGTNNFIADDRGKIYFAAGNSLETNWFSGIAYFSANNDIQEKYKYIASGIREEWN